MEDISLLTVPFQKGESIVVPAGSEYTTTAPGSLGSFTTKRKQTIVVSHTLRAWPQRHLKGGRSVLTVLPPKIVFAGAGGYWKEVTVTEELLELKGHTAHYEEVAA